MMNEQSPLQFSNIFNSLEELRIRKDMLRSDILKDEEQIKDLWSDLFHKSADSYESTPSKYLSSLLSTGASIIDGALLGWKLYHRFNGSRLFGRRR